MNKKTKLNILWALLILLAVAGSLWAAKTGFFSRKADGLSFQKNDCLKATENKERIIYFKILDVNSTKKTYSLEIRVFDLAGNKLTQTKTTASEQTIKPLKVVECPKGW